MKVLKIALGLVLVAVVIVSLSAFRVGKKTVKNTAGFAVVELFTSEGCSSCPPADALVSKIEAETKGRPVYILAYHVDYWNHLGWRDPFSAAAYSQRQRKYAGLIKGASVYTPQIVFNGKKEFIGSEEGTLRNAIKAATEVPATAQLSLSDISQTGNRIIFHYSVEGNTNNAALVVALVQHTGKSVVSAGENGGRTLSHVQIVRQLETVNLKGDKGIGSIEVPKSLGSDAEIIGFLQDQNNGQISAATRAVLNGQAS